jgi:inorganic pyrophosphatase
VDICILTERIITHGDILVQAVPIGGFRMIDGGEADDKIIAVLKEDEVYQWNDISNCPEPLIQRLKHYFLTYKDMPGQTSRRCYITHTYGREEAHEVIRRSRKDYNDTFGKIENRLSIAVMEALKMGYELAKDKNA